MPKCGTCLQSVSRYDDSIICSTKNCSSTFHVKCVDMSVESLTQLKASGEINKWICDTCNSKTNKDGKDANLVLLRTKERSSSSSTPTHEVLSVNIENLISAKPVSWVRRRDWHILSSGMFTYTNDERFQILHAEGSDDWTLQIKYVQKRDNGTYACQVSSSTGTVSHFVNLQIVVPEATIQGGSGEHHVDVGSVIDLVCIIEKSPTPPQYVFWYHNNRMINYDTARGGITVETVPGVRTQSRLTIRDTNDADSGNYTCSASNTEPASIYVFVSEGDNVDAILMRKSSSGSITRECLLLFLAFLYTALR